MIARAVSDLPEPDSPTSATRSFPTVSEILSTSARAPSAAPACTDKARTTSSGCSVVMGSLPVPPAIGEAVQTQTRQENRRAWRGANPPLVENHLAPLGDHRAPFRRRRSHPKTEKP